jgi:hypothetical protein
MQISNIHYQNSKPWLESCKVFSVRARQNRPSMVLLPKSEQELEDMLIWLNANKLKFTVRSGGHCFSGSSVKNDVVLLNLSLLNKISVDGHKIVTAQTGALSCELTDSLSKIGRAVPLGDCPTVGLGGLISGGGFGYAGRKYGLTCDSVLELKLALPNGKIIRANDSENKELFWGMLGGQNSFGIALQYTLKTFNSKEVILIKIKLGYERLQEILPLYFKLIDNAPEELDLKLKMRTTGRDRFIDFTKTGPGDHLKDGQIDCEIDGQFLGKIEKAKSSLAPLLDSPYITSIKLEETDIKNASKALVPLAGVSESCPETIRPARVASDFLNEIPDNKEVAAIVNHMKGLQNDLELSGGSCLIEPANGKIHNPDKELSFSHRRSKFIIQWIFHTSSHYDAAITKRENTFLNKTRGELKNCTSNGRYINYCDQLDSPEQWWQSSYKKINELNNEFNSNKLFITHINPLT